MLLFNVFVAFSVFVVSWLIRRILWPRKQFLNPRGLAVFISGCDTGIGHRLAIYFSDFGCEVFAGCLDPEKARQRLPDRVHVVPLDVTDNGKVKEAVEIVQKKLAESNRDLWALVNNAGVCVYGQFEWQTWQQCEKQIQVNVLGTMRLTKAFIPILRKAKGRVITVSSVNGLIAYPGLSIYSASKFALEGLNDAVRLELYQQYGIRVITIHPGDYARLTSIMARHEQNAQEMWDNMSPEDQGLHGDFFHRYHETTLKYYGLTSPSTFEGSHLLKDMQEAILGFNPKDKYISCSFGLKIVYNCLAFSPSFLVDFVLGKAMNTLIKG